jgi:hypothetical protein
MNRRRFLAASAVTAGAAAPLSAWALAGGDESQEALPPRRIRIPSGRSIRTAFAIGPGVNVIDTAGPWEVFCDTAVVGGPASFDLYTVAASTEPVEGTRACRSRRATRIARHRSRTWWSCPHTTPATRRSPGSGTSHAARR